jgi:hypothetical protein
MDAKLYSEKKITKVVFSFFEPLRVSLAFKFAK